LKYYNKQIHEASFVLPTFANEILNKQWQSCCMID
jgi:spermidine synthase